MSATELLERVRALPIRERQRFVVAVLALSELRPAASDRKARRVRWPNVQARAQRIFGTRVMPNLVLLERDEAAR
jgi:hypothetical protein